MKKTAIFITLVLAVVASAFTLAQVWKADSQNSTVSFDVPVHHKKGTFGNLSATINFDKKNLAESKVIASIDVKTLKTGAEKLDIHLLSPDYFNAEKFPKIIFTSTEIKSTETGFLAKGTLNMKDSTKIIELPFTFTENDKTKAVFSGTMTFNASDYGVMEKKADKPDADLVMVYLTVPVTK